MKAHVFDVVLIIVAFFSVLCVIIRWKSLANVAFIQSTPARFWYLDALDPACPLRNSVVVFMARLLSARVLASAVLLRRQCVDAHIMLDKPVNNNSSISWVHYLPDSELERTGFRYATGRFEVATTAWDRALLWCHSYSTADYMWLVEDDVSWSPANALADFIEVGAHAMPTSPYHVC